MISVTERAATALQDLLVSNDASPGEGVKLAPDLSGRIGMTIDAPVEGDEVVHRGEMPLLIVDGRIAQQLDGTELDLQEIPGQEGAQFTLRPLEA